MHIKQINPIKFVPNSNFYVPPSSFIPLTWILFHAFAFRTRKIRTF